jgi:hypothetical protein
MEAPSPVCRHGDVVRREPLRDDVVLVEPDITAAVALERHLERYGVLSGRRRKLGIPTSMRNSPPRRRSAAALQKTSTCPSCVVTLLMVLNTR